MDDKAIIIFGLLGLGLLFMLARGSSNRVSNDYSGESIALPFKPTNRVSRGAHQYTNKEKWSIKWNEDGLPSEVIIERNAVQT